MSTNSGIEWTDATWARAWPLDNVWLGTSVENQATADERIPHLLKCPAAVRFLSVEPMLGPVDLERPNWIGSKPTDPLFVDGVRGASWLDDFIDWVIVGGESGAHARPCDVGWIRSIVGQCKTAGVPVFVKQLGAKPRCTYAERGIALGAVAPDHCADMEDEYPINDRKGGDMAEWPEDLRVREMPTPHGGE